MDHMMPGMDGIEALSGIRAIGTERARNVPVVALTANVISGNEAWFLENGFQAFLAKPLDMRQLDAVLLRFIPSEDGREEFRAVEPDARLPAWLQGAAAISGLDVETALKRFSGDAQAYWRVLESWARHTPGLLEQARAVSRETLADYIVVMHGIKGGCLGIGATRASQAAAELEAAARNGDFAFVAARNADCLEMLERLLADLSALLARRQEAEKPLAEAPDAETLARLKAACAAYDMDGVDAALAELDACRYRKRQELVAWLCEQAKTMDFTRMTEELAKAEKEGDA
jgi:CheY-like chemotaxis protein